MPDPSSMAHHFDETARVIGVLVLMLLAYLLGKPGVAAWFKQGGTANGNDSARAALHEMRYKTVLREIERVAADAKCAKHDSANILTAVDGLCEKLNVIHDDLRAKLNDLHEELRSHVQKQHDRHT